MKFEVLINVGLILGDTEGIYQFQVHKTYPLDIPSAFTQ